MKFLKDPKHRNRESGTQRRTEAPEAQNQDGPST